MFTSEQPLVFMFTLWEGEHEQTRVATYGSNPARRSSYIICRNSALIALTLATWALLLLPCFQLAATIRALPSDVVGPRLRPPCSRQRDRPFSAGFWQGLPFRFLAKQRLPGQSGPKRVLRPNSINSRVLTVFNIFIFSAHGVARPK